MSKNPNTDSKASQHIDLFGNLNHFDLYENDDNIPTPVSPATQGAIDLSGRIALSAALKFPISYALNLSIAKAMDVPYKKGTENFWNTTRGYKQTQANNLLNHRTRASLIPVTLTNALAQEFDLPSSAMVVINTAFESTLASLKRESTTRFHAINVKKYCFTNEKGKGVNLINLSHEKFIKYCLNHPETKDFGDKEWDNLQKRIRTYNDNWEIRAKSLILRNAIFSASIFLAKPLAQKFVDHYGDAIEKNTPMTREAVSTAADCGMRLGLACLTTCFDRVFSRASSGKFSAEEIGAEIKENLKNGNFRKAFGGGSARLAFVTMGLGTLIAGPNLVRKAFKAVEGAFIEEPRPDASKGKLLGTLQLTAQEVSKSCKEAEESCRLTPATDTKNPNAQPLKQTTKSHSQK